MRLSDISAAIAQLVKTHFPVFLLFLQDAETRPAQLGGGGCAYAPGKHSWLIASETVPDTLQPHQVGSLHLPIYTLSSLLPPSSLFSFSVSRGIVIVVAFPRA